MKTQLLGSAPTKTDLELLVNDFFLQQIIK